MAEVVGSLAPPRSQWGGPDPKVPMALGAQGVAQVLGSPAGGTGAHGAVSPGAIPVGQVLLPGLALCPQRVPRAVAVVARWGQ